MRLCFLLTSWWCCWWCLLVFVEGPVEAQRHRHTQAAPMNRRKRGMMKCGNGKARNRAPAVGNVVCDTGMTTTWRGVDCEPLYTSSRPACARCLMHIPATQVLPPETIVTSSQAVLAELLTRYTITSKRRERTGSHIRVYCRGMKVITMKLLRCTILGPEGKVRTTKASISAALDHGLLRFIDRKRDSWMVKCRFMPPFFVQRVKKEEAKETRSRYRKNMTYKKTDRKEQPKRGTPIGRKVNNGKRKGRQSRRGGIETKKSVTTGGDKEKDGKKVIVEEGQLDWRVRWTEERGSGE